MIKSFKLYVSDEVCELVSNIPYPLDQEEVDWLMAKHATNPPIAVNEEFSDIPDKFYFCDRLPGRACETGGEYGFYTHYQKTAIPGWFYCWSSCTCSFDNCGTGWEGIVRLTHDDLNELREREAEVYAEADKEED